MDACLYSTLGQSSGHDLETVDYAGYWLQYLMAEI